MHCYIFFTWVAINVLSLHAENLQSPSTPTALKPYNAMFAGINNQTNKDAVAPHNRKRRFLSNVVEFFKKAMSDAKKLTTNMEYEKKILEEARKQGAQKFYNKIVETKGKEELANKYDQLKKNIKNDMDALKFDSKEQKFDLKRNENLPKPVSSEKDDSFYHYVESYENEEKVKPLKSSKKPADNPREIISKYSSKEIADIIKRYENEEQEWMGSEARANSLDDKELKKTLDAHKRDIKATLDKYTETMLSKGLTKETENLLEYNTLKAMKDIMGDYEKELMAKMEVQALGRKTNSKFGDMNVDAELKKNKMALRKTFAEHEKDVRKMFHDYTKKYQNRLRELVDDVPPEDGSNFRTNQEERERMERMERMRLASHEEHFDPHFESEEKFNVEKLARILKERSQMDTVMDVLNKLKQPAEHTDITKLKEAVAEAERAEDRLMAAKKALAQERELRLASSIKKANKLKAIRDRLFEARKDSLREEVFRIHLTPQPDTALGDFLDNMRRDVKIADKLKKDVLSRYEDVSSGELKEALQKLDMLRQKAELRTERLKHLLPDMIPKQDAKMIKKDLELVEQVRNIGSLEH